MLAKHPKLLLNHLSIIISGFDTTTHEECFSFQNAELSVETALIATDTLSTDSEAQLVEIPYDLDIEVQVMRPKDVEETEQLYQDTV